MVSVRLLCFILLMGIVAARNCGSPHSKYACICRHSLGWTDANGRRHCHGRTANIYLKEYVYLGPEYDDLDHTRDYKAMDYGSLCKVLEEQLVLAIGSWIPNEPMLYSNCTVDSLMPAMLEPSCNAKEINAVAFYLCRKSWLSWLSGICAGQFIICAAQSGELRLQKVLLLIYIFLPPAALVLLVLVHGVGHFFMRPPLMGVDADKSLRKKIKHQAVDSQRKLENGNLNESLMWPGAA